MIKIEPDVQTVAVVRRLAADGTARQIREEAKLSLHDLATAVGVADSTLCRWEKGQRSPRGELAVRWAGELATLVAVTEDP